MGETRFLEEARARFGGKELKELKEVPKRERYVVRSSDHFVSKKIYSPVGGRTQPHYPVAGFITKASPTGFEPVLPARETGVLGRTRRGGQKVYLERRAIASFTSSWA